MNYFVASRLFNLTRNKPLKKVSNLEPVVCLHEKKELEAFFRQDTYQHIYSLGDLDDFYWPYTLWFGTKSKDKLEAVVLLYTAISPPVLLALASGEQIPHLRALLISLLPLLPQRVYTHLSPGVEDVFSQKYNLTSYGLHYKMALIDRERLSQVYSDEPVKLSTDHLPQIMALYQESYPGNAFDPRMIETGECFGIWRENKLVSIAGIHVYSPKYLVAAIGNITTHPDYRKLGLGKAVTAALCHSLLNKVEHIGLNVKADNVPALKTYQHLGFKVTTPYHEILATLQR